MRMLVILAVLLLSTPAFADDGFGARFGTQSSVGFEDTPKNPAEALSEIMPAAGDENADVTTSDNEAAAQDEADEDVEGLSATKELR